MNPNRNRKRGKATERQVAKYIGGRRVGLMGNDDICDCGPWSVEVKDRVKFSGSKFLEQAERNAPKGKTAIAIVHVTGQRHDQNIVMMRLKEWWAWHGELRGGEE